MEEHCSPEGSLPSSSWDKVPADSRIHSEQRERKRSSQERPRKPALPKISGEVFLRAECDDQEAKSSHRTRNHDKEPRHQDWLSPKSPQKAGLPCKEAVYGRDRGQGEHRGRRHKPSTPPSSESEEHLSLRDAGNNGQSPGKSWSCVPMWKPVYLISLLSGLFSSSVYAPGFEINPGTKRGIYITSGLVRKEHISIFLLLWECTDSGEGVSISRLQWRCPSQIHTSDILTLNQSSRMSGFTSVNPEDPVITAFIVFASLNGQ